MNYLEELNEAQREAVVNSEGPTLIVAGPGSGKTRVLTYRIAHLLQSGADPFSILALTFTNKASDSMRQRIEKIAGTNARSLYMGTFHSVFARILRVEAQRLGYPSNFTIYDTDDSRSLIKAIIKEQNLDDKIYKPNQIQHRISSAKNALITPAMYATDADLITEDKNQRRPATFNIYKLYCERCFKSGAMDFDDLLLNIHVILEKFPDALYKYQHKFKYVLIDEFQDTNYLQYSIVKRIADVYQNITVVGDDAQSIYAFRGATIDNILNFEKDFPELKVYKLEQNYRSTQNIVKAANELIHNNRHQLPKEIWTQNGKGDDIKIVRTPSDNEEGRWVADSIMELKMRDHFKNNDFAILYRTNAQSRALEEALRRHNIPYKIYGGMSFYQRKEVKDLLAYLKLTVNPYDEEALKRVINYPARGIGQTTIDKIIITATNENLRPWDVLDNMHQYNIPQRTKNAIEEFVLMMKSFSAQQLKMNAYDLAAHIGKTTRLIAELYNDKTVEGVSRFENIQELLNSIKEFVEDDEIIGNETEAVEKNLGGFLQNVALLTGDDKDVQLQDSVKMMTIHAAKGLEFAVVYVVGMEENLFPGTQSLYSIEDLEEERRLFYVAITRAEKKLFLTYANTRYKFGQLNYCDASRFLNEVPEDVVSHHGDLKKPKVHQQAQHKPGSFLSQFQRSTPAQPSQPAAQNQHSASSEPFVADDVSRLAAGTEVLHEKFGEGKVISIEGVGANKIATVQFGSFGLKKIMLKFARVKILNGGLG
ncbi:MAG: UvrD-helicase domain-containing protein [Bacteroidetes bacterium]|nr:UvrD-helicase domain-containing protein [Bacteroidota bacterium]MBK8659103.1 UvrD-helicase domain-containing protein [Bacteroidota bacterium]